MYRGNKFTGYNNKLIMPLSTAKITLEQDLIDAFYDAYKSQVSTPDAEGVSLIEDPDSIDKSLRDQAEKMGKGMAQAIHDYVTQMSISVTLSGTVISPSGPCVGTIPPTSFQIL
jgi:hypothetical protein